MSDSGMSDAGTSDAGTSDAGMNDAGRASLQGPSSFPVTSAEVLYPPQQDGGASHRHFEIYLTTLSADEFCRLKRSGLPAPVPGSYVILGLVSYSRAGDAPAGDYLIQGTTESSAPGVGFAEFAEGQFFGDAGENQLNVDQSGTINLTGVTFPTGVVDGGFSGGSATGSLTATITLGGGTTQSLSGTFAAHGCN